VSISAKNHGSKKNKSVKSSLGLKTKR